MIDRIKIIQAVNEESIPEPLITSGGCKHSIYCNNCPLDSCDYQSAITGRKRGRPVSTEMLRVEDLRRQGRDQGEIVKETGYSLLYVRKCLERMRRKASNPG